MQGARNDPGFNGNLKLAVAFGRNRGCSPGHEMKRVHLPRSAKLSAPFLARGNICGSRRNNVELCNNIRRNCAILYEEVAI